ncbi:MAG: UDP-N-acetylmuramoyl-L-alanine--D-glutamate ligase [Actinomycetota bacterium]|nr:UDP-N-acetylmuramoyl-L-alanine--D-glutamate ligase [Actinomycetota bacterium]
MSELDLSAPLVVGFGVTGQAVVAALLRRGFNPVVVDDRPSDVTRAASEQAGLELVEAPSDEELAALVGASSVVLPSPGLPAMHSVFEAARAAATPIRSEFDLAAQWDDRPIVSITGTNGKTTVTLLVADALERSGIRSAAVGNTETPLVEAIEDATIDVFVVEASSFRLLHSGRFEPRVATWLNFAPDHLDAHLDLAEYEAAKASIWAHLPADGVAIGNRDDPIVMAHLPDSPRSMTFGLEHGDWRVDQHGWLMGPDGPFVEIDRLSRRRPHDLANALAVAATATAAGATLDGVVAALVAFDGFEHRVQFIGEWNAVAWYNDSKATVPHATLAALGGFDSVVLIAGGKNKGLELTSLARGVPPVRAVVATGAAADEVEAVFAGTTVADVRKARSMEEAVELAASLALPGDTVLLSPACTSYDWYANYGERGRDFIGIVTRRFA